MNVPMRVASSVLLVLAACAAPEELEGVRPCVTDACGTCDDDPANDCVADCAGVLGGAAALDPCGVCDADPSNDCLPDCAGVAGGSAYADACGTCDGDSANDCVQDCAGVLGGLAYRDGCGVCDADATNDCPTDCLGVFGGSATYDGCGTCDANPANDCSADCAGVFGGTAYRDGCGTCDAIPANDCVQDCAGVFGGAAYRDACGTCVGGTTGGTPCDSRCAGLAEGATCAPGSTCVSGTCTDVNECLTGNGGCGSYSTCVNQLGAPRTCADRDMCLENNGGCSAYSTCIDTMHAAALCLDANEFSEPIEAADAETQLFGWAYAPTILHTQGAYHAYFCSGGYSTVDWDRIRHTSSSDLLTWSSADQTSMGTTYERSNCDPSIVRHDKGDGLYYYLFMTGNVVDYGSVNFVARSTSPQGPFLKLTARGTWESQPPDTKIITAPMRRYPEGSCWLNGVVSQTCPPGWAYLYGAGQPSVVIHDGRFYMWFTDTSAGLPQLYESRIFLTTSQDLMTWTTPVQTNVAHVASIDVKYEAQSGNFVMIEQDIPHQRAVAMRLRTSADGVTWTPPQVVCDSDCHEDWANNIGMSGDERGHIESRQRMVFAYAAPYDLDPGYHNDCTLAAPGAPCWPAWNLYANVVKLGLSGTEQPYAMSSAQSNDVLWGAALAIDGVVESVYSSNQFASAANDRGVHLVAYMASRQPVSKVLLTARLGNEAFPKAYNVYVTAPDNSAWVFAGSYGTQPGADGVATVKLTSTYETFGVLVSPTTLGQDGNGSYYFQMAEIGLAGW